MHFPSSLVGFFYMAIGLASAMPTSNNTDDGTTTNPTCDPTCTPIQDAVPLFRLNKASITDHFYTASAAEADNAVNVLGFVREGTTGLVFQNQVPGTVPVHRLYNSTTFDHAYTTAADPSTIPGYDVYDIDGYNSTTLDHAYTTAADPSTIPGYDVYGIDGYIYSRMTCGAVPWFRLHNSVVGDHIYTTSVVERDNAAQADYVFEGIEGYILPSD